MPRKFPRGACLPLMLLLLPGVQGCPARQSGLDLPANVDPVRVASANTRLGIAYLRQNNLEEAERVLRKAVAAAADYPPPYQVLGLLYSRAGDLGKADVNFRRALELEPDNPVYLNAYGQFLCRTRGRRKEGLKLLLQAAGDPIYNTPEIPYLNAGLCSLGAGQRKDAEQFLLRALQRNPKLPEALLEMSVLRYQDGGRLSARAYLQRYEQAVSGPRTPRSLLLGVCIERLLGDKDQLASYELQLRNQHPDSDEAARLKRGDCL